MEDNIQHEVHLFKSTSLKKAFIVARKVESKNIAMAIKRTTSNTYRENNVPSSNPTQRLTPQQLDERRAKALCFNCDNKYSKGHKCGEKKLFYIDCEGDKAKEQEPSQAEETEEITPTISCHALAGISTPQTLDRRIYQKGKGNSVG